MADPPSWETVYRQARVRVRGAMVLIALVCLAVGGVIGFSVSGKVASSEPEVDRLPTPAGWLCGGATAPAVTPTPGLIQVYVSGAVQNSRVITLPAGSLVADALQAVGGAVPDADLERINLAAPVADHQQILVPHRGAAVGSTATPEPLTGVLDLNAATAADLERLPRIGPATAQRIVAYRDEHGPFQRVDDLLEVPGIGPATLAQIAPYLTIEP